MSHRHFREMLEDRWEKGKFLCVGLDSDHEELPLHLREKRDIAENIFVFNIGIIDATMDHVCCFKPNIAFYEKFGEAGLRALKDTIAYIKVSASRIPVILDCKRGDIGNSNHGYVLAAFNELKADAVTVSPYLGQESLRPFLACEDKGIFILCRTSNPGAGEFQDLPVAFGHLQVPLYEVIANNIARQWNENNNCGLVVGATQPEELRRVRGIVGDLPFLIPGIGAQGGDLEKTVRAAKNSNNKGFIINSSRAIIFASKDRNFATRAEEEAKKLNDQINQYL